MFYVPCNPVAFGVLAGRHITMHVTHARRSPAAASDRTSLHVNGEGSRESGRVNWGEHGTMCWGLARRCKAGAVIIRYFQWATVEALAVEDSGEREFGIWHTFVGYGFGEQSVWCCAGFWRGDGW